MLNEIDPRHEDLIAASAAIAGDDPYSMVIAYARLGVDRSAEMPLALQATLETDGGFGRFVADSSGISGFLTSRPDTPVSNHFGIEAWTIDHLLYSGESGRAEGIDALINATIATLRAQGVSMVSTRIRTDDLAAMWSFQRHGFHVMDTMVTHSIRPKHPDQMMRLSRRHGDLTILAHTTELLPEVDKSVVDAFANLLNRYYTTSRFHADRRLDPTLASSYYSRWCREAFAGRWSDGVIAAYLGNEPVGFVAGKFDALAIQASDIRIYGSGLAASQGHGGYGALVAAVADDVHCDLAEFTAHVANFPVQSAIANHGSPHTLWANHALHLWLD